MHTCACAVNTTAAVHKHLPHALRVVVVVNQIVDMTCMYQRYLQFVGALCVL
jgi:hypothetical protein